MACLERRMIATTNSFNMSYWRGSNILKTQVIQSIVGDRWMNEQMDHKFDCQGTYGSQHMKPINILHLHTMRGNATIFKRTHISCCQTY